MDGDSAKAVRLPDPTALPASRTFSIRSLLIGGGCVVLVSILLLTKIAVDGGQTRQPGSTRADPAPAKTMKPMPGTVMEKIDGSASMAYTLDDVRAAMTYAKQGNNTAFAQMIYNGKIRPLPNGTRVEVVNLLDEILEVSVKSGQYAGEHGYMNILMVDIDGVPFGPVETPRRR